MDDDLSMAPAFASAQGSFSGSHNPSMVSDAANTTLSNLLNIPDSFMEHYNRVNNSSNTVNQTCQPINFDSYGSYSIDSQAQRSSPFTSYVSPDLCEQQTLQLQQTLQPQQTSYIKPESVQFNNKRTIPFRRSRITTIGDTRDTKSKKEEDYYLFNTDIQPSQLMDGNNFFNPESELDNSLFITNKDLDTIQPTLCDCLVPGFEADYLIDDFAEDAEIMSEDSDDDNYFQDDEDLQENVLDFTSMSSDCSPSPEGFMKITPDSIQGPQQYDLDVCKVNSIDSIDMQQENFDFEDADEDLLQEERTLSFEKEAKTFDPSKFQEDHHQTAAEISATNPNHQCDLINPMTEEPCNKQFSRPYDLIRHQETIHASKKKIFRCVICEGRFNGGQGNGKLKTFSRGDALSRHIKVKHGLGGQEALDLINEAKENVEYILV